MLISSAVACLPCHAVPVLATFARLPHLWRRKGFMVKVWPHLAHSASVSPGFLARARRDPTYVLESSSEGVEPRIARVIQDHVDFFQGFQRERDLTGQRDGMGRDSQEILPSREIHLFPFPSRSKRRWRARFPSRPVSEERFPLNTGNLTLFPLG